MKARLALPNSRVCYIAPCYDAKTEILTDEGWKQFSVLTKKEKVATYKNGQLIFEKPKEYFVYDYDGEMVGIDNNSIDQLVTPHHRCLVKNHRKGDWHIKKAEEIENTWVYRFKKDAEWEGEKADKNWARFWGWYVSEGYARKRYTNGYEIVITQQKEEFFDDIRKTLNACSLVFKEDKRTNGINFRIAKNKKLTEECLKLGKSHQKYIPHWILDADIETIQQFLDAYWNGDGHYPKSSFDYKRVETKSELLADQLQELIIKIGGVATVRKINGRDLYSVSWLNKKFNTPLIRKSDYYRVHYVGKVYCVRVSSGVVMVRRNGKHYWSGNTYQQARDIAWEQLRNELRNAGKINESRLEIELVNGSKLLLRGWEAIETLRGQRFDLIVLDEVAMMRNFWLQWQGVIRPTLTDTKGESLFISTPKGFNHFYDLFNLERKDGDFRSFQFNTANNPHIPQEEINKAQQELTEDRFAQEYLADFRKIEGLVYKEFDRKRHLFEEMKSFPIKTIGGVDFGFTNPAAIITIKKDKDACYWVTDEWYKKGQTDAQIADYVQALKWDECYPDPESAGGIEELKRRGVNVREVVKGKDSIRNGINAVRELFKTNRLKIHSSCRNLLWEIETYSYRDSNSDKNDDEKPIKDNDHALDALRYALAMDKSKEIEMFIPPFYEPESISTNPAE